MRNFEPPLWLLLEHCIKFFLSEAGMWTTKFGNKAQSPPDPSNVPQCGQRHGGLLLYSTVNGKEKDGETVKVVTLPPHPDLLPFTSTFKGNGRHVIVSRAGKRSRMHADIHTEPPETKSHTAGALENCAQAAMN